MVNLKKITLTLLIYVDIYPLSLITFVLGGFLLTIFAVIFGWITVYKKIREFNKTQGVDEGKKIDPLEVPDGFQDTVEIKNE